MITDRLLNKCKSVLMWFPSVSCSAKDMTDRIIKNGNELSAYGLQIHVSVPLEAIIQSAAD